MKSFRGISFVMLNIFILCGSLFSAERGVVKSIPAPDYPYGLTFDGTYLWVGTSYANSGGDFIWKVDTADGSIVGSIPIPEPVTYYTIKGLTFDGQYLWVFEDLPSSSEPDKFCKMDPATGNVLKTIDSPVDDYVGGIGNRL